MNAEKQPVETLEDAIDHINQALRTVYAYQYEQQTPLNPKERSDLDALVRITKVALREMFYATRVIQERDNENPPPAPFSRH